MAKAKFNPPAEGWIPDSPENQLPGFDENKHRGAHIIKGMLDADVRRNAPFPSQLKHVLGDQSHFKHNAAVEGVGNAGLSLYRGNSTSGVFNGLGNHSPDPDNQTLSDRVSSVGNAVLSGRQHLDALKKLSNQPGELAARTAAEFKPGGILHQADTFFTNQSKKTALLMKLTEDYVPQRLTYVRNPDPEMQDDGEPETGSYRYK